MYKLGTLVRKIAWLTSFPNRLTRKRRLSKLSKDWTDTEWYPCSCTNCGWVGSSKELGGGEYDSWGGDYSAVYCGICQAEEEELED